VRGFNNLLPDPFCRRVRGHIDPDKLIQLDEEQAIAVRELDATRPRTWRCRTIS
jgi:hypothetical protein